MQTEDNECTAADFTSPFTIYCSSGESEVLKPITKKALDKSRLIANRVYQVFFNLVAIWKPPPAWNYNPTWFVFSSIWELLRYQKKKVMKQDFFNHIENGTYMHGAVLRRGSVRADTSLNPELQKEWNHTEEQS